MTELRPLPEPVRGNAGPLLPRQDAIQSLPIVALHPHSRCNCRCQMCDMWRVTRREEIPADEVRALLAVFKRLGVRQVLSGGEPLMYSEFVVARAALRAAGIGVTLLTTGLLLRRYAGDVARFCDDVIVSPYGPRAIPDQIRNVAGAFDKIAGGIEAVRAARTNLSVSGRCTVQRANFRHMRSTVTAAHHLGLDRFSFLAVDVSTEAFNRPGGWTTERAWSVALDAADLTALEDQIRALEPERAGDFATGYIVEPPEKLRMRLLQYFTALYGLGGFALIECNAPWVSTVIETDGTVRPCFFQPALGNVRTAGGLDTVLNSPGARAWRSGLDTHRDAICRTCVCSIALGAPTEIPDAV